MRADVEAEQHKCGLATLAVDKEAVLYIDGQVGEIAAKRRVGRGKACDQIGKVKRVAAWAAAVRGQKAQAGRSLAEIQIENELAVLRCFNADMATNLP